MKRIEITKNIFGEPNPATLDEALEKLHECIDEESKTLIKSEGFNVCELHHGFGMAMRNNWKIWFREPLTQWFIEKGIYHADDISAIILTCFQRQLRNEDLQLGVLMQHYKDYWANNGVTEEELSEGVVPYADAIKKNECQI